LHPRGH